MFNLFSNETSALGGPLDTTPTVPAIPLGYILTFTHVHVSIL
jgi:hypothetical protein